MLRRALDGMKRRCEGTPQESWYRSIVLWHEIGPGASALSYADLGQKLGASPQQAANFLFRGRTLLRTLLLEELSAYCATEAELEEEIGDLFKALAAGGGR